MRREDLCPAVRNSLVRLPPPHDAHYGVVPMPPPAVVDAGPVQARNQAALAVLARIKVQAEALADSYTISRILTRREAVSSSSIEGTNSTLDELLTVEEVENEDATTAVRQVRDYALALDGLVPAAQARGSAIFSLDMIQRLHRTVMDGDPDYQDVPGDLRQRVVWIGGGRDIAYSIYNPPPPEKVPDCVADNIGYLQADGMEVLVTGTITRMAVFHAHLEAIHPFRDGNGRVGRLLLPLIMAAEGEVPLYLSPYIEARKTEYYAALKAAQQRLEWHEIIGFMADAVVATVAELEATQAGLRRLIDSWRTRRSFRKGSAALRSLDLLPHYPVITIRRLSRLLNVSFPAASLGIEVLMESKILIERTGYARNRIFVAAEALSIINRPFGAVPVLP